MFLLVFENGAVLNAYIYIEIYGLFNELIVNTGTVGVPLDQYDGMSQGIRTVSILTTFNHNYHLQYIRYIHIKAAIRDPSLAPFTIYSLMSN